MEDSRESTSKKEDVMDIPISSKRRRYDLNKNVNKHRKNKFLVNDNIITLPEEIMLKIFTIMDKRTLVKCSRVCHQWRRIAYDTSLWQKLNIPLRSMSVLTLDNLLARNIRYFSASYSNFHIVENQYLCMTPFPKLQYLDLSFAYIHVKTLHSLLRQCSNLIKLSLEMCEVDILSCQCIGHNTNLKVLNLSLTFGLDRNGLEHIVSLQNLEELNVSLAKLDQDNIQYLMANMIPNIKRLNISGFFQKFDDFDLSRLSSRCTKLIELNISSSLNITASSVDKILEKNHELKVLSINRCYNVVTPRLLNIVELSRRRRNSTMSLSEVNFIGLDPYQIFGYINHFPDLDLKLNSTMFCNIGRPKMFLDKQTIWEIPVFIDC